MITKTAEEIAKMDLIDFLAKNGMAAMFINHCTLTAGLMGVTGEPAIIAYALGIGTSLAANDVIEQEDMTGFDGYIVKLVEVARLAYHAAYVEIKRIHAEHMKQEGHKTERPQ